MSESFAELFESSGLADGLRPGSIVSGRVERIGDDMVVVDVRLKSEGRIPIEQFQDERGALEVAVGDEVEVALDSIENGHGQIRLSREKAKWQRVWGRLEDAYREGANVRGHIVDRVKGGFIVSIEGVRAFLPASLLDIAHSRELSELGAQEWDFRIIKLERRHNNVVVSRRTTEARSVMESLEEGQVVKGVVKNLTDYGAFLDIGGIDGLLHVTDMSWKRLRNPSDAVAVGDEYDVKLLKVDRERNRISLGLKQMREDPWSNLVKRYPQGRRLHGKVTNIVDYGCFVELEEGVEGLVHISEMDWTRKSAHPGKLVHMDQEVEVEVLGISEEKRRISLGMKQCRPNPWQEFNDKYKKGDRLQGKLRAITDFGIFLGLDGGLAGLVHVSDLSWTTGRNEERLQAYNNRHGEVFDAVLLAVDLDRERISLGIKQLEPDPFAAYIAEHPKGSAVSGEVKTVEEGAVELTLAPDVTGQIKVADLSLDEEVRDARKIAKVGDALTAKLTHIDRKRRTLQLSVREQKSDEEKAAVREYSAGNPRIVAKLGELFKRQLKK